MNEQALKGKIVIVTGGGRGLGRAMTLAMVEAGAMVTAASRGETSLSALAEETASIPGHGELLTIRADIRNPEDCRKIVDETVNHFGGLHVLVNNAGLTLAHIYPKRHLRDDKAKFWEASDDIVQDVFDTNYVALDRMTRLVIGRFIDQGWGRIINMTSKIEIMNRAATAPYGASKAAVEMSSEAWMRDLEGTGVTINLINPGAADTEGFASPEEREIFSKRLPLVDPARMGPTVVWLSSDAADDINGYRFEIEEWDSSLPPEQAARAARRPLGLELKPKED